MHPFRALRPDQFVRRALAHGKLADRRPGQDVRERGLGLRPDGVEGAGGIAVARRVSHGTLVAEAGALDGLDQVEERQA